MISFSVVIRFLKVVRIIIRYRIDELINFKKLPLILKLFLFPINIFKRNKDPRGKKIRKALEDLGPIYIKFGQLLSTRKDLLPNDISQELDKLQDQVPPFPTDQARKIIEHELGDNINDLFIRFDDKPLGSASVAQVHSAKLKNEDEVVIKIIRPNIKKTIKQDISLMFFCARILLFAIKEAKRVKPIEIIQDYQNTILDELDLMREAANASQLKRNFEQSQLLYIPKIYWNYSRINVMVMERIYGVPISDVGTLKNHGTDMKKLAELGTEIFFTQVFTHRFFHADMHPGNIFVNIIDPQNPQYIGVDFGIMGSLEPEDQYYIASNLLAFFHRDYRKVAQLHIDSGWVPKNTSLCELEAAVRTVCEPIFEKPLKDISFGHLLVRLFQVARRFNMTVQPQLVLLEKTLLNVEGLGRQLYPQLDLWSTGQPFLEKWVKSQVSPCALSKAIYKELPNFLLRLPNEIKKNSKVIHHLIETQREQKIYLALKQKKQRKNKYFGSLLMILAGVSYYHPNMIIDTDWITWIISGFGIWFFFK